MIHFMNRALFKVLKNFTEVKLEYIRIKFTTKILKIMKAASFGTHHKHLLINLANISTPNLL